MTSTFYDDIRAAFEAISYKGLRFSVVQGEPVDTDADVMARIEYAGSLSVGHAVRDRFLVSVYASASLEVVDDEEYPNLVRAVIKALRRVRPFENATAVPNDSGYRIFDISFEDNRNY